jgi:hypothetical protein
MFIAPNAATYATRVPYITPAEFKAHPTGVETTKLAVGGSTAANDQALLQIIRRASSLADGMCGNKILAATVDTQSGRYKPGRDGKINIALDWSPVVAVDTVTAGLQPGSQIALQQGPDWSLEGRVLSVPTSFTGSGQFGPVPDRIWATVRYVNGWANTVLTQASEAGALSLTLNNALGIVPGMTLSLSGSTTSEFVVVDPSYVPSTAIVPTVVPLAAPTAFGYAVGDVCTAFPSDVKLAIIFLTAGIIKARGSSAFVMASTRSQPDTEVKLSEVASTEMELAAEILSEYRRTI